MTYPSWRRGGVVRTIFILLGLSLIFTGCGGDGKTPTPAPAPVLASSFGANVAPVGPPPYSCGQGGPFTSAAMADLNRFWRSASISCNCQADAAQFCTNNAAAGGILYGYVFYDGQFLDSMAAANGVLATNLFLAHEFGHNIQTGFGLPSSNGKYKELQADCFAGFYAGFKIHSGAVSQADIAGAFRNSCQIGDANFSPWWLPGAHGTCVERVAALDGGIRGYLGGLTPFAACPSL